jgi:hypothetical protein
MKRSDVSVLIAGIVILAVIISLPGCRDDDGIRPNPRPRPTLENIWPNEDGTTWEYDYVWRTINSPFPTRTYDDPREVPPVPSLDEIEELLEHCSIGDNPSIDHLRYNLEFDGDTTTVSGKTAQNLRETITDVPFAVRTLAAADLGHPFLYSLAIARPDLRVKIAPYLPAGIFEPRHMEQNQRVRLDDDYNYVATGPNLLHGYAWEKTEDHIGTYSDLDTLLAYKYLESNLNPGHEFTFQLVPTLASDVFLHCRILRQYSYRFDNGERKTAVECLYLIDYGVAEMRTPYDPVAYFGGFDYGSVTYVKDVGPVHCLERDMAEPGNPVKPGIGEQELILDEMTPGATP